MAFELKSSPPPENVLAVHSEESWLHGYKAEADSHMLYWDLDKATAQTTNVNMGWYAVASNLIRVFNRAKVGLASQAQFGFGPNEMDPGVRTTIKRHYLGSLALSLLIRQPGITSPKSAKDARAEGLDPNFIFDIQQHRGFPIEDYRIHVTRDKATDAAIFPPSKSLDQWYKDGPLWVHRTSLIPSILCLIENGPGQFGSNPDNMATLWPYLEARPGAKDELPPVTPI